VTREEEEEEEEEEKTERSRTRKDARAYCVNEQRESKKERETREMFRCNILRFIFNFLCIFLTKSVALSE
jgi:hypothetical protein